MVKYPGAISILHCANFQERNIDNVTHNPEDLRESSDGSILWVSSFFHYVLTTMILSKGSQFIWGFRQVFAFWKISVQRRVSDNLMKMSVGLLSDMYIIFFCIFLDFAMIFNMLAIYFRLAISTINFIIDIQECKKIDG